MKVTDQAVSGTVYFDNAGGRFVESKVSSKVTMEIATAGMEITSGTDSQMLVKLVSVEKSEQ